MDWHAALGILTGAIQIGSAVPYVRSILRGTTKPNVISFVIWATLSVIDVAAQTSAGASWSIVLPIVITFNTLLVVALGIFGYGYKKYHWPDFLCFALALGALAVWGVTKNPVFALLLTTCTSIFATIPTALKTYREPHSEAAFPWFLTAVASVFAILSTTLWNTANLIIPASNLVECGLIAGVAFFGQRLKKASS